MTVHCDPAPSSLPPRPDIDWARLEANRKAGRQSDARRRQQRLEEARTARAEVTASASTKSLAERLSAAPTYTPIAHRPIGIDVPKYSATKLAGIFKPKFDATLTRLAAVIDIGEKEGHFDKCPDDHVRPVHRLVAQLQRIQLELNKPGYIITWDEFKWFEHSLTAIGELKFAGLRRNFRTVVKDLARIETYGGFEIKLD